MRESYAELRKVDWPTRNQTFQGVIVVIIACTIVGLYLWGLDQIIRPSSTASFSRRRRRCSSGT